MIFVFYNRCYDNALKRFLTLQDYLFTLDFSSIMKDNLLFLKWCSDELRVQRVIIFVSNLACR